MTKKTLNRLTAVTLMSAVLVTGSFAMTGEDTFAASKSPAQPKITKAAIYDNNNVKLQWSKTKNAVKYKVYRKKADGKFVLVKTTAKRTYQSKKLAYGTKYTYKVTAVSKAGKKNTSKIKVIFTNPAKPVISSAKVVNDNTVKLTWTSAKGAVKYKVYRKKAGGKYVLVKTTAKRSYESKPLAYSTKYTYKVKAVSKNNKTTESKVKTVTTGKKPATVKPQTPAAPETPNVPDTPTAPETPNVPDTPAAPSEPSVPEEPGTPAVPETPAVPAVQDCTEVGHNFQLTKVTSPTCTDNGYNVYQCSRCKETKQEVVFEVLGHDWFVNAKKDSTYTEEGTIWYICSRCQETKTEVIPKKEQPSEPVTPEEPAEPAVPSEPATPDTPSDDSAQDETPAERTVTVKVPIYETEKVYWIKTVSDGKIIYKSTDADEWENIWKKPSIVIDGVYYDPNIRYGSGAIDEDEDGYTDEKYEIIVGYREYTVTESEFYAGTAIQDRINAGQSIIVIWND